jgi:hypothetical protein
VNGAEKYRTGQRCMRGSARERAKAREIKVREGQHKCARAQDLRALALEDLGAFGDITLGDGTGGGFAGHDNCRVSGVSDVGTGAGIVDGGGDK